MFETKRKFQACINRFKNRVGLCTNPWGLRLESGCSLLTDALASIGSTQRSMVNSTFEITVTSFPPSTHSYLTAKLTWMSCGVSEGITLHSESFAHARSCSALHNICVSCSGASLAPPPSEKHIDPISKSNSLPSSVRQVIYSPWLCIHWECAYVRLFQFKSNWNVTSWQLGS